MSHNYKSLNNYLSSLKLITPDQVKDICLHFAEGFRYANINPDDIKRVAQSMQRHIFLQTGQKLKLGHSRELLSRGIGYENWTQLSEQTNDQNYLASPADLEACCLKIQTDINQAETVGEVDRLIIEQKVVEQIVTAKKMMCTTESFEDFFSCFKSAALLIREMDKKYNRNSLERILLKIEQVQFSRYLYDYRSQSVWHAIKATLRDPQLTANNNHYEYSIVRIFSTLFTYMIRFMRRADSEKANEMVDLVVGLMHDLESKSKVK